MTAEPSAPDAPDAPDTPDAPETPTPGTRRPGGRTARVRTAVLRAAEDALVERGFSGLDLGDVAQRAEVGRTTVYRRWGTTSALVADLLADMAEQSLPRTRSGSSPRTCGPTPGWSSARWPTPGRERCSVR